MLLTFKCQDVTNVDVNHDRSTSIITPYLGIVTNPRTYYKFTVLFFLNSPSIFTTSILAPWAPWQAPPVTQALHSLAACKIMSLWCYFVGVAAAKIYSYGYEFGMYILMQRE